MARLYFAIIYLCFYFGEVRSLLDLADSLDMSYSLAWRRLKWLEKKDARLRVIRRGRGYDTSITYEVDVIPGVITDLPNMLYRESYETSRRSSDPQRRLSLV